MGGVAGQPRSAPRGCRPRRSWCRPPRRKLLGPQAAAPFRRPTRPGFPQRRRRGCSLKGLSRNPYTPPIRGSSRQGIVSGEQEGVALVGGNRSAKPEWVSSSRWNPPHQESRRRLNISPRLGLVASLALDSAADAQIPVRVCGVLEQCAEGHFHVRQRGLCGAGESLRPLDRQSSEVPPSSSGEQICGHVNPCDSTTLAIVDFVSALFM